jgi:Tol biopolymer transport system component
MANNGSAAFASLASNLVPNDANASSDVFVHNVKTDKTRRVSLSSAGSEGNGHSGFLFGPPKISADGERIAFDSAATNLVGGDSNGLIDVFLHNRANQTTRRMSVRFDGTQSNGQAFMGDVSSNGKFVSFLSNATNLVGGDSNGFYDVFVRGPIN